MPGLAFLKSRPALLIGLCLFCAAAVSWARDRVAGTIGLDVPDLALAHKIWPFLLFGCFAALAGHLYLKTLRRADQPRWSYLLAGAIAIQLLAAPALPLTSSDLFAYVSYARLISVSIRFHAQSPQQHTCAKKLNHAINAERFEQQTFRGPAKQERRRSFNRHPT